MGEYEAYDLAIKNGRNDFGVGATKTAFFKIKVENSLKKPGPRDAVFVHWWFISISRGILRALLGLRWGRGDEFTVFRMGRKEAMVAHQIYFWTRN